MAPNLYTDTSVFGGYFETEFEAECVEFIGYVRRGFYVLAISPLVESEVAKPPLHVRTLFWELMPYTIRFPIDVPCRHLMQAYLRAGVVTAKSADDALHVATASVWECDGIVSLNMKHLVTHDRAKGFNQVNRERGYNYLDIRRPEDFNRDVRNRT